MQCRVPLFVFAVDVGHFILVEQLCDVDEPLNNSCEEWGVPRHIPQLVQIVLINVPLLLVIEILLLICIY